MKTMFNVNRKVSCPNCDTQMELITTKRWGGCATELFHWCPECGVVTARVWPIVTGRESPKIKIPRRRRRGRPKTKSPPKKRISRKDH